MPCAKAHLERDVVPYRPSIGTTRPRLPWPRRAHPSRSSHLPRQDGEPAAIRPQTLRPGDDTSSSSHMTKEVPSRLHLLTPLCPVRHALLPAQWKIARTRREPSSSSSRHPPFRAPVAVWSNGAAPLRRDEIHAQPAAAVPQRWKGATSEMANSGEILSWNAPGYSLEDKMGLGRSA